MAALIRSASNCRRVRSSTIARNTTSSFPDASPARTMAIWVGSMMVGWRSNASAKLSPAAIAERMAPANQAKALPASSPSVCSATSSVRPAPTRRANCRRKMVTSRGRGVLPEGARLRDSMPVAATSIVRWPKYSMRRMTSWRDGTIAEMRHLFRLEACGHAKHFVDGRQPRPTLCNAVFDHCAHPLAARDLFEHGGFGLWPDRFSDLRRDLHHLEQALASAEAAEAAPLATTGAVNDLARFESQGRKALVARKIGGGKTIGGLAMLAQHAHQALTNDNADTGSDEKALDAEVDETGDRSGGRIGVQRGQDKMARQRRMHADMRRLAVAHFTHHDDIGIMAQE